MTQAQAQALAKMRAANAALTPDERKARSAKAAAASAARTAALKAAALAGNPAPVAAVSTATTEARAKLPVDAPMRSWRVLLLTEAGSAWHVCEAQGMRRAIKQARKACPGAVVRGVLAADAVLPK